MQLCMVAVANAWLCCYIDSQHFSPFPQTNPFDLFETFFGPSMGGFPGMDQTGFRTRRRSTVTKGEDIRWVMFLFFSILYHRSLIVVSYFANCGTKFKGLCCFGYLWVLWIQRNLRIFENKAEEESDLGFLLSFCHFRSRWYLFFLFIFLDRKAAII